MKCLSVYDSSKRFCSVFGVDDALMVSAGAGMANTTNATGQSIADITLKGGMAAAQANYQGARSLAQLGPGLAQSVTSGLTGYADYTLYQPVMKALADRFSTRPAAPSGVQASIAAPDSPGLSIF